MVDVCFINSLSGMLKLIKGAIGSDEVLFLNLQLNYGLLDCDILAEQSRFNADALRCGFKNITEKEVQKEYERLLSANKRAQDRLYRLFEDNEEIRLWISNSARERCGLFWLCSVAKNYSNKISTVVFPGYTYDFPDGKPYTINNWASCEPEFLLQFFDKSRELNDDEISAYSANWGKLVKENASLRILIDDTVVSTNEDFFDDVIIGFVTTEPQPQTSIIGQIMSKWGAFDAYFVAKRIECLIERGMIKVCEEKVNEYDFYWPRTLSLR